MMRYFNFAILKIRFKISRTLTYKYRESFNDLYIKLQLNDKCCVKLIKQNIYKQDSHWPPKVKV